VLLIPGSRGAEKIPHGAVVLALVNDTPITFGDVWAVVGKRLEMIQMSSHYSDKVFSAEMLKVLRFTLDTMIKEQLIEREAKKKKFSITDQMIEYWAEREIEYLNSQGTNLTTTEDLWQFKAEYSGMTKENYQETMRKRILVREYLKHHVWSPEYFSPKTVRSYYQKHRSEFRRRGYITVRHILISRREPDFHTIVEGINNALQNGEDFREIARKAIANNHSYRLGNDNAGRYRFSYGTGAKQAAGEQHCDGRIEEKLNALLREKVLALKKGEVSEPIATFSGTHFFKIIEKEPGKVSPFSEVQDRIQQDLQEKYRQELEEKYIEKLIQKNSIKYFPFPEETPMGPLPKEDDS
jgi:hypothetical protein